MASKAAGVQEILMLDFALPVLVIKAKIVKFISVSARDQLWMNGPEAGAPLGLSRQDIHKKGKHRVRDIKGLWTESPDYLPCTVFNVQDQEEEAGTNRQIPV